MASFLETYSLMASSSPCLPADLLDFRGQPHPALADLLFQDLPGVGLLILVPEEDGGDEADLLINTLTILLLHCWVTVISLSYSNFWSIVHFPSCFTAHNRLTITSSSVIFNLDILVTLCTSTSTSVNLLCTKELVCCTTVFLPPCTPYTVSCVFSTPLPATVDSGRLFS